MAAWLGYQTWKLHQAHQQGHLASMPLFASALASGGAVSRPASANPSVAAATTRSWWGPRFKPFEGQGHTLGGGQTIGKSTPNGEVCLASALAVAINALLVAQVA